MRPLKKLSMDEKLKTPKTQFYDVELTNFNLIHKIRNQDYSRSWLLFFVEYFDVDSRLYKEVSCFTKHRMTFQFSIKSAFYSFTVLYGT